MGGLVLSCYACLQMENLPTSCNILPVHFTSTWRSVDYVSPFFSLPSSVMAEWKVFYALPCLVACIVYLMLDIINNDVTVEPN